MMVSTKKDVQLESCELSFIWGKMRIVAWGTIPQIALRNRSKGVVRGKINICDFVEGGIHTIKHLSYKMFPTKPKELMSP